MAGIVDVSVVLEAAHLRAVVPLFRPAEPLGVGAAGIADALAVIDADRRHVLVLEKLVLIVADDDENVELRRGDLGLEAFHRVLHSVETSGDRLGGDQLRNIGGCAGEDVGIGARPALAVVVLHAKVALTKSTEPVLQLGGEHDAVGGTERGGDARHSQSILAPDCLTTRVHRCRSWAAHAPNSSGAPLWGTRPKAFILL